MPNDDILPHATLVSRAREMRAKPTRAELRLWFLLRKNQLGVRVMRQRPFAGFILDFYIASKKLAIEVDGSSHNGREEYDRMRTDVLRMCGISVMRFTNNEVLKTPAWVVDKIRERLADG